MKTALALAVAVVFVIFVPVVPTSAFASAVIHQYHLPCGIYNLPPGLHPVPVIAPVFYLATGRGVVYVPANSLSGSLLAFQFTRASCG